MKYFVLFDKKNGHYQETIFSATSIADAVRSMGMHLSEGKGMVATYPADYQLCLVGDFDFKTGAMVPPTDRGPIVVQEVSEIMSDALLGRAAGKTPMGVVNGGKEVTKNVK